MISQLTVFLENKKGLIAAACRTISDADINMHTLFIADTGDFGVARIFCDTPLAAAEALNNAGFQAAVTQVVGVKVPNHKGGLAEMLAYIDEKDINIEYGYCYAVNNDYAIDVLKTDSDDLEQILVQAGYEIVRPDEIYVG